MSQLNLASRAKNNLGRLACHLALFRNRPHIATILSRLAATCRGGLQVPMLRSVEKQVRNHRIQQEFDGANYAAIARRYRLSTSQVRNITGVGDGLVSEGRPT